MTPHTCRLFTPADSHSTTQSVTHTQTHTAAHALHSQRLVSGACLTIISSSSIRDFQTGFFLKKMWCCPVTLCHVKYKCHTSDHWDAPSEKSCNLFIYHFVLQFYVESEWCILALAECKQLLWLTQWERCNYKSTVSCQSWWFWHSWCSF